VSESTLETIGKKILPFAIGTAAGKLGKAGGKLRKVMSKSYVQGGIVGGANNILNTNKGGDVKDFGEDILTGALLGKAGEKAGKLLKKGARSKTQRFVDDLGGREKVLRNIAKRRDLIASAPDKSMNKLRRVLVDAKNTEGTRTLTKNFKDKAVSDLGRTLRKEVAHGKANYNDRLERAGFKGVEEAQEKIKPKIEELYHKGLRFKDEGAHNKILVGLINGAEKGTTAERTLQKTLNRATQDLGRNATGAEIADYSRQLLSKGYNPHTKGFDRTFTDKKTNEMMGKIEQALSESPGGKHYKAAKQLSHASKQMHSAAEAGTKIKSLDPDAIELKVDVEHMDPETAKKAAKLREHGFRHGASNELQRIAEAEAKFANPNVWGKTLDDATIKKLEKAGVKGKRLHTKSHYYQKGHAHYASAQREQVMNPDNESHVLNAMKKVRRFGNALYGGVDKAISKSTQLSNKSKMEMLLHPEKIKSNLQKWASSSKKDHLIDKLAKHGPTSVTAILMSRLGDKDE